MTVQPGYYEQCPGQCRGGEYPTFTAGAKSFSATTIAITIIAAEIGTEIAVTMTVTANR